MKTRTASPAKSILETAAQTAAPQFTSDSPPRASGIPVGAALGGEDRPSRTDVPLSSLGVASGSASEISNFKSAISDSASASPSQLSTFNSQLPASSSPSEISNLKSSDSAPSAPSDLSAALDYIATNPASEILAQFQSHFSSQSFDPENERDLKRLELFLTIYAKLQNSAAFEQVSTAISQMGEGPKREKLYKELVKIMSIQDRSIARGVRQQESIEKEKRRIEREAKQAQSQAAKFAREDRAFNQREDHLTRKEKMVKDKLDLELTKHANLLREQVIKHTNPQTATQRGTDIPVGVPSSSLASSASEISNLKSEITASDSPQAAIEQHAA